jgi:hypothetical protein
MERQGMEACHAGNLAVGAMKWHSDWRQRVFPSMLMDSAAILFRAEKLRVFEWFKGGTSQPVPPQLFLPITNVEEPEFCMYYNV